MIYLQKVTIKLLLEMAMCKFSNSFGWRLLIIVEVFLIKKMRKNRLYL